MSDLRDLYQEVILDHNKRPRNFRIIPQPTHHADGVNPLCGDRISVDLDIEDGVIRDIAFQGAGCAISSASASLMTEALKGKRIDEVEDLFEDFHHMVTTPEDAPHPELGKLEVLAGVSEFPARVKCATLAWHTLQAALKNQKQPISTE